VGAAQEQTRGEV